jgi:hypothetical protein
MEKLETDLSIRHQEGLKLQSERVKRINQVNLDQYTLSSQIYFKARGKRVPWRLWQNLNELSKINQIEENQVRKIHGTVLSFVSINEEIHKLQMMSYLSRKDINLPKNIPGWSSNIALAERKALAEKKASKKPTKIQSFDQKLMANIDSNRFILLSLVVTFFLGVFSVYIRIFVGKIVKGSGFKQQRKELVEAIRFWKL